MERITEIRITYEIRLTPVQKNYVGIHALQKKHIYTIAWIYLYNLWFSFIDLK